MTVVEFQHVKPGKGGAFVRTKLKNFRNGAVIERTFRADEKVPHAVIDKREMQYLYREGDAYVFMDHETTSSSSRRHQRRPAVQYLKEGDHAVLPVYNGEVVGVDLPAAVELTVTDTEPGMQGDRVSGARKAATLETGLVIQVPLFVEPGETRQGRHPLRGVPRPSVRDRPWRHGARRGNGPWRCATRPRPKVNRAETVLAELPAPPDDYTVTLVRGVGDHGAELDELLRTYSERWAVERMPAVDRALLRIGSYELSWQPDLPVGVVIDEAVELARQYSTADSARFVHALLARIADHVRDMTAPAAPAPARPPRGPRTRARREPSASTGPGSSSSGTTPSTSCPTSCTCSRSSSATPARKPPGSCCRSTTTARPSSPTATGRKPKPTCPASTPTASGPRWSTRHEPPLHPPPRRTGRPHPRRPRSRPAPRPPRRAARPLRERHPDPARDRLFPRAYLDPTEEQAEQQWQELVYPDLLQGRLATSNGSPAPSTGRDGRKDRVVVHLDPDDVQAWLGVLNDARLALGTRIGVTDETDLTELDPDDPNTPVLAAYGWLTYLEGELVETLLGTLPD